ncbi:DNA cytosine methyltransferase [Mesorhizobium sp. M0152]|uniref:DNA cytosine methyltransferase n=1 Tax=Mesorhizobium sp. M0152 TaxID=2956898 RepID=UPI0033380477
MSRPRIVDLFCGCSGLGLGAREAGFAVPLSVDIDPILTSSHRLNFNSGKLLLSNLHSMSGGDVLEAAGGQPIDGIVGGPPCQGFSSIGRLDPEDPRRELLWAFFRIVMEARPRFFVMENVRGLLFPKNRPLLDACLERASSHYEIVGPVVIDAADHGAATRRVRIFVIGYDKNSVDPVSVDAITKSRLPPSTVRDAISDLTDASCAGVVEGFDQWTYGESDKISEYAAKMRGEGNRTTTGHRKIAHDPKISARFAQVAQGATDPVGRYPRLAWLGQAPTIRAGTGPDKGSYQAVRPLHPSEPRVITVREAARLQGFPDWFRFHPTAWHSFRMVGNSVSPFVSRALLSLMYSRVQATPIAAE